MNDNIKNITRSVVSIFEGLAVTMSWMFRKPTTVQYPFAPKTPEKKEGGPQTLAPRYRGLLEVDMATCTACLLCEQLCPINCIKIDIERVPLPGDATATPVRAMTRFDIDMGKCMYCGLCVEPCPTEAIRHTRHFEGSTSTLLSLVARFVEDGKPVVPYKVKKGEPIVTPPNGEIAEKIYFPK